MHSLSITGFCSILDRERRDEPIPDARSSLLDDLSLTLFTESPDAVFLVTSNAIIQDANPAAERFVGWSRKEMVGACLNDWLRPEIGKPLLSLVELLQAGASLSAQSGFQFQTALGSSFVETTIIRLSRTEPSLFWVSARPEKRSLPGLHHLRASLADLALKGLNSAVQILDPNGRILFVNPAFCSLVGWREEELIGQSPPFPYWPKDDIPFIHDLFSKLLQGDYPESGMHFRFRHRKDYHFDALLIPSPLSNDRGERIGWVNTLIDVTEQKRTEMALRASEERFRSLAAHSPFGIFMTSPEGICTWINNRYQKITGYAMEEALGHHWTDYLHPEDQPWLSHDWRIHAKAGKSHSASYRLLQKEGQFRWVRSITSPIRSDDRRILGHVGMIEDISEQKQAEEVRQRLEQERQDLLDRLQLLLEKMPVGCITLDSSFRISYVNPATERIFHYTYEELKDRDPFGLLIPESARHRVEEIFSRMISGESLVENMNENLTKDGRRIVCQWSNSVLRSKEGNFLGILSMCQDVTDRRRSEEVLRESERRYRFLADNSTDMISRHDPDGKFLYVSPACIRITGYTPQELIQKDPYTFILPEDVQRIRQEHLHLADTIQARTVTFRAYRKDGSIFWFESTGQALRDPESGSVIEIHVTSRDITMRKQAEEALRRSEERFRALVEKSSDGFGLVDQDLRITYASPATTRMLGYTFEDLQGVQSNELVHPEDLQHIRETITNSTENDNPSIRFVARIKHKNGSWRNIEVVTTNYLNDPLIGSYVVNYRDVTDQIKLEEQLRQSQKMDAIGKLAGGIAHDFNNILTAIIGNVSEIKDDLPETHEVQSLLKEVDISAKRAAELTSQLLSFSRRNTLQMKPIRLNRCVEEALVILKHTIDPRIVIEVDTSTPVGWILGDASQIASAIVNLCINARDAMPRGGRLNIALNNVQIDSAYVERYVYAHVGSFAHLRVEDNGLGMTPEVQARIFEPFFTTKPIGQGTGLGLAMVYGTVKAHNGWINCESKVGQGTRFDLYFPFTEQTAWTEDPSSQPVKEKKPAMTTGLILLVDDEPSIRLLAKRILEMHGYKILLAEDGQAAVETFRKMASEISLVIMDLTMPRMSGQDAFRHMREIDPNARVIFSSGYSADSVGVQDNGVRFITKPYRPDELARVVRETLNGS